MEESREDMTVPTISQFCLWSACRLIVWYFNNNNNYYCVLQLVADDRFVVETLSGFDGREKYE